MVVIPFRYNEGLVIKWMGVKSTFGKLLKWDVIK